jgi:thioredoxin-related protein
MKYCRNMPRFLAIFVFLTLVTLFTPLSAQRMPGTGSTRGSLTPSTNNGTGSKSTAANSGSTERNSSAARNSTTSEKTSDKSSIRKEVANDRNSTPSYSTRNYSPRPSQKNNTKAAAKTAPSQTNKVAPLKKEVGVVKWLTLEQAIEKNKVEKRKIFIDVYTDWCGWCKHMDSTTFNQSAVANYLNEHFYPVKFNAEQQNDIVFKDKTWKFVKNGSRGHHELAANWLNNRLSFPTTVFLDENLNTIQPLGGYLDAAKMEAIINYFGTDSHRTTPWESYEKKFNGTQR